jgi:hypothetical protein
LQVGATPQSRVVAVIIAPQAPIAGQGARGAKAANNLCSPDFTVTNFLDNFNGVSNSNISNVPGAIDDFIRGDFSSKNKLNDRVITITRDEIFNKIVSSKAFNNLKKRTIEALAWCISDYGQLAPDNSLPWPAPLNLADYQKDRLYNDENAGANLKFGRYPFIVDNSSAVAGKAITDTARDTNNIADLLDQCKPRNNIDMRNEKTQERLFWKHWKDHFYYAVSEQFRADGAVVVGTPDICTPVGLIKQCVTVNNPATRVAAIVLFSGSRLNNLGQLRNASPPAADADTKQNIANYLEGNNATFSGDTTGTGEYQSGAETNIFNDILYCIDFTTLNVRLCQ